MRRKQKRPAAVTRLHRYDRRRVYMGDIRRASFGVREEGEVRSPYLGIWVDADTGMVVSSVVALDDPASALADGLIDPAGTVGHVPFGGDEIDVGATAMVDPYMLPGKAVVFDSQLAQAIRPKLASRAIAVEVSARIPEFDELLDSLFGHMAAMAPIAEIDLPDDVLRPLCAAAERFWEAKPWRYAYDHPPIGIVPTDGSSPPVYPVVLGAGGEVFGLAIYTSLADYVAMVESEPPQGTETPAEEAARAVAVEAACRHRVYLLTFDRKEEVDPILRDRLAGAGWSRRRSVVPVFVAYGASKPTTFVVEAEARRYAPIVDAVVAFLDESRDRIPMLDYLPLQLRAEVTTSTWPEPRRYLVTMPPDEPPRRRRVRRR